MVNKAFIVRRDIISLSKHGEEKWNHIGYFESMRF